MKPIILPSILGLSLILSQCKSPNELEQPSEFSNFDPISDDIIQCDQNIKSYPLDCPSSPSLFDQIFSSGQNGKISIPNTIPELMGALKSKLNVGPVAVLVPTSRSLQKYESRLKYFKYPRVLLAIESGHEEFLTNGQKFYARDMLYIGYSEPANQLEVISFNPEQGRFEFQIVTDFHADRTPKSFYVQRKNCTRCHQNEGPIFPELDWDETNANGQMSYYLTKEHGSSYQGINTVQSESITYDDDKVLESFLFDESTDRASENVLFWQKLWKICANDRLNFIGCRKALTLSLIRTSINTDDHLFNQEITDLSKSTEWGEQFTKGILVEADSNIPNIQIGSDAFLNAEQKSSIAQMKARNADYSNIFRYILLQNSVLNKENNPAVKRQLRQETWKLKDGVWTPTFQEPKFYSFERRPPSGIETRNLYNFATQELIENRCVVHSERTIDCTKLALEVIKPNEDMVQFLNKESMNPLKLLRMLLSKAENSPPSTRSPLIAGKSSAFVDKSKSESALLYQYCGSCHGLSDVSEGPAFLPDLGDPQLYKQIRQSICHRLDWNNIEVELRMPPAAEKPYGMDKMNQYQRLKNSPDDLQRLKNELNCKE